MSPTLNLSSPRAKKARFALKFGKNGYHLFYILAVWLAAVSVFCFTFSKYIRLGYLSVALALALFMVVIWYHRELAELKPAPNPKNLDDVLSSKLLAFLKPPITPKSVWLAATNLWPALFLSNHLLLSRDDIIQNFSDNEADMPAIWQQAINLMQQEGSGELGSGTLVAALMLTSPSANTYLKKRKLSQKDLIEVYAWLERLQKYIRQPKPNFGGIGRDWAMGYAPMLEKFSINISRNIEMGGGYAHFLSHADVLDSVISDLDRGAGVALVGPPGVGKTQLIYGLAERLLEGNDPALHFHQIISLNASMILSSGAGQLESLMLNLFGEAIHAGNLILFLDEAELFFGSGVGAFNMSQLLLPVLQNHHIKIIAAFPEDYWQKLRATNESLAAEFASIIVQEPSTEDTMKILEDTALLLESRSNLLVSYQAVTEAYRLSGQYMQELAYPGKAINALEQSTAYASNGMLTDISVQTAFEKTRGVKVTAAEGPEVDILMHLEQHIHSRMINQKRAVNVVSAALRRGRAGVSNPKRPVGSFLFLGPTGVGKTELARSLAAVYFTNEKRMIRLDMSEYQRPDDVARLLNPGTQAEKGLLMSIREDPFSVVLLDEIEKANPQILNLLLQLLDEGQLTDESGKTASFRSAIIIATSNAGSSEITEAVNKKTSIEELEDPLIDKLIKDGVFKPELVNRFDEIVLFTPLSPEDLAKVASLMLEEVNKTLETKNISVKLTDPALKSIIKAGYNPKFGARPMRRIIQKTVEDAVAVKILDGEAQAGSEITLDEKELEEHLKRNS